MMDRIVIDGDLARDLTAFLQHHVFWKRGPPAQTLLARLEAAIAAVADPPITIVQRDRVPFVSPEQDPDPIGIRLDDEITE